MIDPPLGFTGFGLEEGGRSLGYILIRKTLWPIVSLSVARDVFGLRDLSLFLTNIIQTSSTVFSLFAQTTTDAIGMRTIGL